MATCRYAHLLLLVLYFLCVQSVLGNMNGTSGGGDETDWEDAVLRAVGISAGYLVLYIAVPIVFCGGFSLVAYLVLRFCYKGKTGPSGPPGIHPGWTHHVAVDPELAGHGFWTASSGISILNQNSVVRHHQQSYQTDGARWSHGFTCGRHIFEVMWSRSQRGSFASIGVATANAPMSAHGNKTLVGDNKHSWGFDLTRRRAVHNAEVVGSMKLSDGFVPDTFYMYLNAEDGKVGFGTPESFYGYLLTGIPRDEPLYPMIGTMMHDAHIQMHYRGSAADMSGVPAWAMPAAGSSTVGSPELYAMGKGHLSQINHYPGCAVPVGEVQLPNYQDVLEEGNHRPNLDGPHGVPYQTPPSPPPPYSTDQQKY